MNGPGELVESGIQAYLQGRADEARVLFERVLAADPANAPARSYLILLGAGFASFPAASLRAASPLAASPLAAAPRTPPPAAAPPPTEPAVDFAPSPWDEGPASGATIVLEPDGGLDLDAVAEKSDLHALVPARPAQPVAGGADHVKRWLEGARELFALGDFSGSLEMIERILEVDPGHAEARRYLGQNEATLIAMYESKLGSRSGVPRLAIQPEEILWLNLDHRAGFLLSQIDGTVAYEDLFALSGLPRLDTARILAALVQDGVIAT